MALASNDSSSGRNTGEWLPGAVAGSAKPPSTQKQEGALNAAGRIEKSSDPAITPTGT